MSWVDDDPVLLVSYYVTPIDGTPVDAVRTETADRVVARYQVDERGESDQAVRTFYSTFQGAGPSAPY